MYEAKILRSTLFLVTFVGIAFSVSPLPADTDFFCCTYSSLECQCITNGNVCDTECNFVLNQTKCNKNGCPSLSKIQLSGFTLTSSCLECH